MTEMTTGAPDLPTAIEQLRKRVNSLQRSVDDLRETREVKLPAAVKGYLVLAMAVLTWGATQIFSLNREMGEVRTQLASLERTVHAGIDSLEKGVNARIDSLEKGVADGFARIEARLTEKDTARK